MTRPVTASRNSARAACLLLLSMVVGACQGDCLNERMVRKQLESEVEIGQTREAAEAGMQRAGLSFSFDRFRSRFQSTVRDEQCDPYKAVSVYVYLDDAGRVSKIEVFESFTAP